jgi:cell division protein FtsN
MLLSIVRDNNADTTERKRTRWRHWPSRVVGPAEEMTMMTRDPTEPAEAEQADEMEKVQEDAAEERENEGGYQ